jgi:hypothetical protein
MNHPRIWFGPRRLGFGYSPRTWEGWAVAIALFAAAVTAWALGWLR